MRPVGLYVHIPFCARKCVYCDFPSFSGCEEAMPRYVDRLIGEMAERRDPDARIATLYIGGGTPSLLPPGLMRRVLSALRENFSFAPDAECSCECNPGTVTEDFLSALREHGVNRLSMGVQTGQDRLLRLLGRIHTWDQAAESAALARRAGFRNLNLDLMLGLPTQTLADVEETLQKAIALAPTHLSCYGLIVEEGTPLKDYIDRGLWALPGEEEERAMYECCRETLAAHGFQQYEISNFALPGFACRHNTDCWRRKEYIGLGCSAAGFLGNERYRNPPALADYLRGAPAEKTRLSPEEARFESVMLGLRLTEGLSEDAFLAMHGMTVDQAFPGKMDRSIREGLLIRENGHLKLTRRGMDLQNRVLVDFL